MPRILEHKDLVQVNSGCAKNSAALERKVIIQEHGICDAIIPCEWPSGEFLWTLCRAIENGEMDMFGSASINTNDEATIALCWQASARRAMLEKFGYSLEHSGSSELDPGKKLSELSVSLDEVYAIQRRWEEVVNEINDPITSRNIYNVAIATGISNNLQAVGINGDICSSDKGSDVSPLRQDFVEFVRHQCCQSNARQLQWSVMTCPRGVQFALHAHPNLELIYCIRGTLYELRMDGEPITRTFCLADANDGTDASTNVVGPKLTNIKRNWSFSALKAGQWLVNEVGSVHKSFTSARADGGCDLLVLWGGSHANVLDPPIAPNIQTSVDIMNSKLSQSDDSCCMNSIQNVTEIFLPESER